MSFTFESAMLRQSQLFAAELRQPHVLHFRVRHAPPESALCGRTPPAPCPSLSSPPCSARVSSLRPNSASPMSFTFESAMLRQSQLFAADLRQPHVLHFRVRHAPPESALCGRPPPAPCPSLSSPPC